MSNVQIVLWCTWECKSHFLCDDQRKFHYFSELKFFHNELKRKMERWKMLRASVQLNFTILSVKMQRGIALDRFQCVWIVSLHLPTMRSMFHALQWFLLKGSCLCEILHIRKHDKRKAKHMPRAMKMDTFKYEINKQKQMWKWESPNCNLMMCSCMFARLWYRTIYFIQKHFHFFFFQFLLFDCFHWNFWCSWMKSKHFTFASN